MTKSVRILNLGDIVTIDIVKTMNAFVETIGKKTNPESPLVATNNAFNAIANNLNSISAVIEKFKLGAIDESTFNVELSAALKDATSIKLTDDELNDTWNKKLPKLDEFKSKLNQAIKINQEPNHQIIFISATNPKDMRHLQQELDKGKIGYETNEKGDLVKIGGITLHTTYANKKTKPQLIKDTIIELKKQENAPTNSTSNVFSINQATSQEVDVKYVRGVNSIDDPFFKTVLNNTNKQVEEKAAEFMVETLIWNKKTTPNLSDLLDNTTITANIYAVSKL